MHCSYQGGDDDELVGVGDDDSLDRVGVVGTAPQHGPTGFDPDDPGQGVGVPGGVPDEGDLVLYAPYDRLMPPKQAALLRLWDELGIPHDPEKQLFGTRLTIIGF